MVNDKFWKIARWLLFIFVIHSFGAWFFWRIDEIYLFFFASVIASLLLVGSEKRIKGDCLLWFVIYAFSFFLYKLSQGFPNINGLITIILYLFPICVVFLLKPDYKQDLLHCFTKGFSFILSLSLAFWFLFLIGLPLPHANINYGIVDGESQYQFENYYFFLRNVGTIIDLLIFPRFQSVFIEPGYLGCMLSILLFNGNFKIKGNYDNKIFLASLILTFSLAGYILSIFGFIITRIGYSKRFLLWLALLVLGYLIIDTISKEWNDGNNILNNYIMSRLEVDETRGISGNNRMSRSTSDYFWSYFLKSDKLWFGGVSNEEYSSAAIAANEVSAYSYIMRFGLLSFTFLFLYFYYPVIKYSKNKIFYFGLSTMVFLIFVQTIHFTHSFMYVFLFILSTNKIRFVNNKYNN